MTKRKPTTPYKQYGIVDNGTQYVIFNRENGDHLNINHRAAKDLITDLYSMIPGLIECYDFRRAMALINQIRI